MAKLLVLCLLYIILAGVSVTSCFAFRPLLTGLPSDKVDVRAPISRSNSRLTGDARATAAWTHLEVSSTTTQSDKVSVEHEETPTAFDWEEQELGPCVEDTDQSSSVPPDEDKSEAGRSCHRMLYNDYSPPKPHSNGKRP